MDESKHDQAPIGRTGDIRHLIQEAVREFVSLEQAKSEPAYKIELEEERRRREALERKMNELVEENRRSRIIAEEAERSTAVRAELQRLGVQKLDLAFRAVKDDIQRTEDGRLVAKTTNGEFSVKEYLSNFVNENPELAGGFDIDKIRPGMPKEDLERARQEISRIAQQINGSR